MRRYIIHLNIEHYEKKKGDKKADVEAGQKSLINNAKKSFEVAIRPYSKDKDIVLINKEYKGQTFTHAIYVDINEDKIEKLRSFLIQTGLIDIIEPEEYTMPGK